VHHEGTSIGIKGGLIWGVGVKQPGEKLREPVPERKKAEPAPSKGCIQLKTSHKETISRGQRKLWERRTRRQSNGKRKTIHPTRPFREGEGSRRQGRGVTGASTPTK